MLLHYLGKVNVQIFCRCGRKRKQIAFLIASNFVIHAQILIFSVFKITSHCCFAYLLLPSIFARTDGRNHVFKVGGPIPWSRLLYRTKYDCIPIVMHCYVKSWGGPSNFCGRGGGPDPPSGCALVHWRKLRQLMIYSWVKRTNRRPTGLSVRSLETGIRQSSVSQIIYQDLHLKCFKRRRRQELTDANCAALMKRAKLLLQKFPQSATDFVFFTDKKVFSVSSPYNQQNKVSGKLRELWRSLAFSSLWALCGLTLPDRLCMCPATFWTAY